MNEAQRNLVLHHRSGWTCNKLGQNDEAGAEHILDTQDIDLVHKSSVELICIPMRTESFKQTEQLALEAIKTHRYIFDYKCYSISPKEFLERFNRLHPELFLHPSRYFIIRSDTSLRIQIKYDMLEQQINPLRQRVVSGVMKIVSRLPELYEPYEKLVFIYDWFCRNITYNEKEESYNYCALGVFLNGTAVCAGISQAFMMVCRKAGIPCGIVVGNTTLDKEVTHCWNVVRLGNAYYHIDVTTGISVFKKIKMVAYPEFCVRESDLKKRRCIRYDSRLPESDEYSYFVRERQQFDNREALRNYILKDFSISGVLTLTDSQAYLHGDRFIDEVASIIYLRYPGCKLSLMKFSEHTFVFHTQNGETP